MDLVHFYYTGTSGFIRMPDGSFEYDNPFMESDDSLLKERVPGYGPLLVDGWEVEEGQTECICLHLKQVDAADAPADSEGEGEWSFDRELYEFVERRPIVVSGNDDTSDHDLEQKVDQEPGFEPRRLKDVFGSAAQYPCLTRYLSAV